MCIQHNISAMNSYRNFSANNSRISKNLEKLSTGYAINRAGDDAAGLAISEKMRAQITGLEGATKNAKDGISLIQTAEGALTEVHDMLNRMTTLAEQSANGTYQNELDREQLQKEVTALKTEIDRIADSTNFNGLKLLDGSLSTAGKQGVSADLSKLGVDVLSTAETVAAQKGIYTSNKLLNNAKVANATSKTGTNVQFNLTLNITDADGNTKEITKTLRVTTKSTTSAATKYVLEDGSDEGVKVEYTAAGAETAAGDISSANLAKAFEAVLNKDADVKGSFKVEANSDGSLKFTANAPGETGAKLNSYSLNSNVKGKTAKENYAASVKASPVAEDAQQIYDFGKAKIWSNRETGKAESTTGGTLFETRDIDDAIMEVNGKKFVFVKDDLSEDDLVTLQEKGIDQWVQISSTEKSAHKVSNTSVKNMAIAMAKETGLTVEVGKTDSTATHTISGINIAKGAWWKNAVTTGDGGSTDGTFILFKDAEGTTSGGLTLQIGDTSDDYNKMTVSVEDMHSAALGLKNVDISTQKGASEALDKIKSAINQVSDTRGNMGALQNRLDHTINNLGVMRENIQNAESNIRDTDVAEEMMNYTKNNILNQSAQAMLAQANQLPQGVLQLLG